MSLVDGIGASVASAALVLTKAAVLTQSGTDHSVRAAMHRLRNPARAGMTGSMIDARIRLSAPDLPVTPGQNDTITLDGVAWIIWSLEPSPAGSTIMANCTAQPAEAVTPLSMTETDDGAGGRTKSPSDGTPFMAKVSAASDEKVLTDTSNSTISRLILHWPHADGLTVIGAGDAVRVRGDQYRVESVGINDENPAWRRALLARVT